MRALTANRGIPKRCLPAALAGVHRATGADLRRLGRIMHCRRDVLSRATARGDRNPDFRRASQAAERAASYAAWRPEARASLIGGATDDAVALPPPAVKVRAPVKLASKDRAPPPIAKRPAKAAPIDEAEPTHRPPAADLSEADIHHLRGIHRASGGLDFPVLAIR